MRYVFLLNKFSLKNKLDDVYNKINTIASKKKYDYLIEINSKSVSTEDILAKYKDSKNIIIAVGGDGTINRVLNSIVSTDNILGFIPYGTGNDFYRSTLELLNNGIHKIDLGKINKRYFLNVVCFGIDADIGNNENIVHSRLIPEKQRYNISLVYHFLKYKVRKLKVIIDHEVYEDLFTTICVCNGRYYGGGYKVGYKALLNDNKFDIYLASKMKKHKMISLIKGMNKGKHENSKYVKVLYNNVVRIISEKEITCNVDGEPLTSREFSIKLLHNGISVFYDEELMNSLK